MAENRRILLYRIEEQAKNVIFVVIEDNEKEWAFLNTRAMKKATGYVNEVFHNIREVMRDDWNFAIPSTSQSIEFHKSTNLLKARTLPYSAETGRGLHVFVQFQKKTRFQAQRRGLTLRLERNRFFDHAGISY